MSNPLLILNICRLLFENFNRSHDLFLILCDWHLFVCPDSLQSAKIRNSALSWVNCFWSYIALTSLITCYVDVTVHEWKVGRVIGIWYHFIYPRWQCGAARYQHHNMFPQHINIHQTDSYIYVQEAAFIRTQ